MVFVGTIIYNKLTEISTIDLIFVILLLSESIIFYSIIRDFDYNSDYQSILSNWTMQTINNKLISWFFLSKINILLIKKKLK